MRTLSKLITPICILFSLLLSCGDGSGIVEQKRQNKIRDSISLILKKRTDSLKLAGLTARKLLKISDKTIKVIQSAHLTQKLKIEQDGSTYRYKNAERFQSFILMKINLHSKSKPSDNVTDFFPVLRAFLVDKSNEVRPLADLDYSLQRKNDLNTLYLEQIFDYKDNENFVCWTRVDTPINGDIVIAVASKDPNYLDDKMIIGIIKNK